MLSGDQWQQLLERVKPTAEEVEEAASVIFEDDFSLKLAQFARQLEMAGILFEQQNARDGIAGSLSVVISFLQSVPYLNRNINLFPLVNLLSAFVDLDNGAVSPIFKIERPSHRSPDPTSMRAIRAYSAGVMELLMKCLKYSKKESALAVYSELEARQIPVGNPRFDKPAYQTVASWRDRISAGNKTENFDTNIYANLVASEKDKIPQELETLDRETIKRRLLRGLGDVCSSQFGKST